MARIQGFVNDPNARRCRTDRTASKERWASRRQAQPTETASWSQTQPGGCRLVYGFGFCAAWMPPGRHTVAYVRLDGDLLVLRRDSVVDRLPLVDIDDIVVAGWMDTRHIISDPTPLPTGPTQSCLGTPAAPSTSRGHDLRARPAARSADTRLNDILRS